MIFPNLLSLLFVGFGPFISSSDGEMLNRFGRIREWAVMEEQMFWMAKAHVKRLEEELAALNRFIGEYEVTTSAHLEGTKITEEMKNADSEENVRANVVASNPLLIHQLSHRLVTIVPSLQRQLLKVDKDGHALKDMLTAFADPQLFQEDIVEMEQTWPGLGSHLYYFPVQEDLEDSLQSLAILYDTYQSRNVTPENFASALSPETSQPINISTFQAVQISLRSFYMGLYGNAIDWIVYAMKRSANQDIRDYSISKDIIQYTKDFIVKTHNTEFENPSQFFVSPTTSLNFYKDLAPTDAHPLMEESNSRLKRRDPTYLTKAKNLTLSPNEKTVLSYYSLCKRGGRFPLVGNKKLKCYLEKTNPFLTWRHLKIEELSKNPKVLHFYDVIDPGELDQFQLLVANLPTDTETNGVGESRHSPDSKGTRVIPKRTGVESGIVIPNKENVLKRLGRKAAFLLGVDIVEDELFRMTEYVAGRFEALENFGTKNVEGILQFQLNTVESGGESLLGQYGPVVPPVEGSALYWEALLKEDDEGNVQSELWSGSCPVIRGHKLTITKYVSR